MAGKELQTRSKLRMTASATLPYGEQYEGELVSGLRHGRGRYKYRDGSVYTGQWSLGIMHGKGELRSANGTVYTGQWDQGTAHGLGEALYADGRHYVGEWFRGKMHGRGVLTWTKGKGKGAGRDRAVASAGTEGKASSTHPSSRDSHGSGPTPTIGRGVDRYAGTFHLDKAQGEGRYEYADGSWYEGTWKEGSKHGPGVMVWADGSRYEGKWQYNEMVEPGILFTPGTLAIGVEPPVSKDFERLLKTSGPDCALARLRAERQAGQKSKKQRRISNLYADSQGLRFGLPPQQPRQAPTDKRPSSTGSNGSGLGQRVGGFSKGGKQVNEAEGGAASGGARPQGETEHQAKAEPEVHALPSLSVGGLGSLGSVTSATPTAAGGAAFRPSTTASVHTPGAAQHMLSVPLSPSAAGNGPSVLEAAQARRALTPSAVAHARNPVHLPTLPTLHSPSDAASSPPAPAAAAAAQAHVSPPTRAGTASTALSPLPPSAARGRTSTAAAAGSGVSGGGPSYTGGIGIEGPGSSTSSVGWHGTEHASSTMSYSHGSLPFVGGAEYAPAVNRFASIEAQGMLPPSFTQKIQRTLEAANIVPKAGQLLPPIGTPVPPYVEAVYDYADLEEVACGARAAPRAFRRRSFLQGPALRANGSLSPQGRRSPSPTGSTSSAAVPETRADTPGTADSTHRTGRQPRKRAGTPGSNRLSLLRADSAEGGGAFASLKTVYFGDADKSNKSFRKAKGDTVMQDRLIAAAAHEATFEASEEDKASVLRSLQGLRVASPAAQGMARKLAEGFELRFTG